MGLKKFGEFETTHNEALEAEKANAWKKLDDERTIIGVQWRTAGKWGTVGIVAVHNTKMNYWVAYLGVADANSLSDDSQIKDAIEIADWGTKMVPAEAKAFFPDIKDIKYKMAD